MLELKSELPIAEIEARSTVLQLCRAGYHIESLDPH